MERQMTEKLYYDDPFLMEFTAVVLACREEKNLWRVVLDRTAFYPEGGGQPADHGTLGGAAVSDVREKDGEIVHCCDRPLAVGETVEGRVDFARRFDFMQQHSGEHIVSGILCGMFHCDNVGFHIGHDLVTIDFNAELTADDVREVERRANQYIWEDHPLQVDYPSPAALEALEYRSKKALTGQVRIVSWPGADCCACCGTHVARSGQVGMVKLLSCQRFREGVRIELAAGGRALEKELYQLRGRVADLEEKDFARKAEEYAGRGEVLLFEGAMSADSLRKLCGMVQESAGGRCAVFAGEEEVWQYAVSQPDGDLRGFVKELNAALRGRGGGKPGFVQGSVQASEAEIRGFFGKN